MIFLDDVKNVNRFDGPAYQPYEKGKLMNMVNTDLFRFELTGSHLLITRIVDAAWMDLSPFEALTLRAFLRGYRRWQTRRAQHLLERGNPLSDYLEDDYFKTSTHQFEFNFGRLTIIDLQHDLRMLFEPAHLILLDGFIRAHQPTLKEMQQYPEVPQHFHSEVSPGVSDTPPPLPSFVREIDTRFASREKWGETRQIDERA
jgi:hypothetical protein